MRSFAPETLKQLADEAEEYWCQNQRDLPRDVPLDSVVVLRYEKRSKSENKGKVPTEMELARINPTRFDTSAGNPVKEILLKLNLPDHGSILMDSKMEVKLKNFKKDALLKLFKLSNQERNEHVGPKVTSSKDGKVYKMAKRDYDWLMILRCSRSHIHIQVKINEQAQA
ncbi:hypothetical protein Tco_1176267 [Tanacetum coccineum]